MTSYSPPFQDIPAEPRVTVYDPPERRRDVIRGLFMLAATLYLLIYAFEGPVRYALQQTGHDNLIFVRDLLLLVPLALLFIRQSFRGNVHPAFWTFALIIALHGCVAYLNFRTITPVIYGAKFLMPMLFGFFIASALVAPSRKLLWLLALLWLTSLVALYLDKYVVTFPWMGMETHIGGVKVDISRGWDITQGEDKRVAGFTRSSIDAAVLLPLLALVIVQRCGLLIRGAILATTAWAVYLTTQKGALLVFVVMAGIFCLPRRTWFNLLCAALLVFTVLAIGLPLWSSGLLLGNNGGVFSMASFGMRVTGTWPDAWRWIAHHDVFPFATGLGGLSGAMRFFAEDFYNPADNLFIFMYGNFGVLALFYLAWVNWLAIAQPPAARTMALAAIAILAYNVGYGTVLAMIEGPIVTLFIGASIGSLWNLRQTVTNRKWADPFAPAWNYPTALSTRRELTVP